MPGLVSGRVKVEVEEAEEEDMFRGRTDAVMGGEDGSANCRTRRFNLGSIERDEQLTALYLVAREDEMKMMVEVLSIEYRG